MNSTGNSIAASWRQAAFLILLTVIAYLPALRAQFIWDDGDYVTHNSNLHDAAGLARIWTEPGSTWQYYPLVFTTFWFNYHIWGLNPLGYHVDNIVCHAISAILLWRLLKKLDIAGCWLAAAIFALHPVQVESVAWVTERKNVLCGLFYFAAMLAYLQRPGRRWYLPALFLFMCAMLSKTVAATWPAAMLVLAWWKSGRVRRTDVIPLLPFFAIGLGLGLVTARLEISQVGAIGRDWDFSPLDRFIIAGRALWFYAGKALVPFNLTFIYPKWDLQSHRTFQIAVAASAVVILIGLIVASRRIGRAPAAAALLFAGTLAPALGFVNVFPMRYSFVADHFQYLAVVALIVPIAFLAHRLAGTYARLLLIPLLILTFRQSAIYHDSVTLWTDTVSKNPNSWMAYINLGQAIEADHPDRTEQEYRMATIADPAEADTWWKLGAFQAAHKRYAEAEENLIHALEVDPSHRGARADLSTVLKHLPPP